MIPRYLSFSHPPRIRSILRRIRKVPRKRIPAMLIELMGGYSTRHRDLEAAFRTHFEEASRHARGLADLPEDYKLLIGAYFTMEYSIESAALFNPSIVLHPDQSDLAGGCVRFLMSLRATGEGHVSSIVFRRGVIDSRGAIHFDPPPRYAYSARPVPDKQLDKKLFLRKLHEHGVGPDPVERVLKELPDPFTVSELKAALERVRQSRGRPAGFRRLAGTMMWLASANYELRFPPDCLPAEAVIFPATAHEGRGMEDLRLVRFVGEDGQAMYYGTYTAFDGLRTHPMLLETADFRTFHTATLSGRYVKDKGMALFPRQVDGYYLMLARHDGENIHLMRSHDLTVWNVSERIQTPREDWELVQLGNGGSPLETPEGWIMITHGVGPMRRYCLGASLLDLNDPSRLIGRLRRPLLVPTSEERVGYVPNVVYSCGSFIHRGRLIIPYAMADSRTSFATVSVRSLVSRLLEEGP